MDVKSAFRILTFFYELKNEPLFVQVGKEAAFSAMKQLHRKSM